MSDYCNDSPPEQLYEKYSSLLANKAMEGTTVAIAVYKKSHKLKTTRSILHVYQPSASNLCKNLARVSLVRRISNKQGNWKRTSTIVQQTEIRQLQSLHRGKNLVHDWPEAALRTTRTMTLIELPPQGAARAFNVLEFFHDTPIGQGTSLGCRPQLRNKQTAHEGTERECVA